MKQLIALALGVSLAATFSVTTTAAEGEEAASETAMAAEANLPRVVLETSKGNITLELEAEKAPKTVENFLAYVDAGFYDGTIFHRVIRNFMVQGGGFSPDMKKKGTRGPIANEADNGLTNDRGTVAMARTQDPNSATAQFFISSVDNDFLNHTAKTVQGWGYTVFARVVEGMEVVDAISAVPTGRKGSMGDVPDEAVTIVSVKRADAKAESSD